MGYGMWDEGEGGVDDDNIPVLGMGESSYTSLGRFQKTSKID